MARSDDQAALRKLTVQAVDRLVETVDWFDEPTRIRDFLIAELPPVINGFGDIAATLAAEHFETETGLRAELAAPITDERVAQSTVAALNPLFRQTQDIPAAIGGVVAFSEAVALGQGDATIATSTTARNIRYAWVTRGKTCGFCILKASRGPVYLSADKTSASILRADRHAHCDCTAEPVASDRALNRLKAGGYDPDKAFSLYERAKSNVGSTNVSRLAAEIGRLAAL